MKTLGMRDIMMIPGGWKKQRWAKTVSLNNAWETESKKKTCSEDYPIFPSPSRSIFIADEDLRLEKKNDLFHPCGETGGN